MTTEVIGSTAERILSDLRHDGFRVELTPEDAVTIAPRSRLTSERMQAIAASKNALKVLLRNDAGVVERRVVFEQQLACTPPPRVPAFMFKEGVAYASGLCFSCGDELSELTYARCWRCSIAWRLACGLTLSSELAKALDGAKVIA
jgi:hypothetical protein